MTGVDFEAIYIEAEDGTPPTAVTRHSWIVLTVFGVLSVALGILAMAWPGQTLVVLAVIFGIQLIVAGAVRLVMSLTYGTAGIGARVLSAILGVLSLLVGFYAVRHVQITLLALAILLGILWIADGATQLIAAYEHQGMTARGLVIVMGALSVVAGCVVLFWPAISLVTLAVVAGIWLIVLGMLEIVLAFKIRAVLIEALV